jgi:hypothetical protein
MLRQDFVLSQAVLFGVSIRVSNNRFKEGIFNAPLSAITIGLLNMTAHNQATHCLFVQGLAGWTVNQPNTVLIEPWIQRCGSTLADILNTFSRLLKGPP